MPLLIFIIILGLGLWAEIAVFAGVAALMGDFGVLFVVITSVTTAIIGVRLFRHVGRGVIMRLSATIAAGQPPVAELAEVGAVLLAGVCLLIPGFITDILGLVLFFPPTRRLGGLILIGIALVFGIKAMRNSHFSPETGEEAGFGGENGKMKKKPSEVIIEGEFKRKD